MVILVAEPVQPQNGCSSLMIQLEVDQSESASVIYQVLRGSGVSKRQDSGFRLGMAPFSFFPFGYEPCWWVWAPTNTLSSGVADVIAAPEIDDRYHVLEGRLSRR